MSKKMKNEYSVMSSCNKCGGSNDCNETEVIDGHIIMEVETTCKDCGFEDYWAHGRFESHLDGLNASEKYNA